MSESMITRCPKCSTTFRVTQEVLSMAKGKVRCGQCFHIFSAQPASNSAEDSSADSQQRAPQAQQQAAEQREQPKPAPQELPLSPSESSEQTDVTSKPQTLAAAPEPKAPATDSIQEDGSVNPEWLDTLFHEEDLEPYTPPKDTSARFIGSTLDDELFDDLDTRSRPSTPDTPARQKTPPQPDTAPPAAPQPAAKQTKLDATPAAKEQRPQSPTPASEELAPWEVELAELEAQFSEQGPASEPLFSEALAPKAKPQAQPAAQPTPAPLAKQHSPAIDADEPDYMQALHSLAQDVSKHEHLSDAEYSSQESIKQLAAEYSLATLTGSEPGSNKPARKKAKYTWLWTCASLLAFIALAVQMATSHFDQGSRSPELRTFYKTACSYLGCTLPAFEDINAVEIEHVRIQSHPTLANSLQVNAIMTNRSSFAQPMPKLALEFYDLNSRPVAARLFSPQDYLHKDFLDITFMPANTPIHIVLPIQDPGARAVTHQIKVFASDTQSY